MSCFGIVIVCFAASYLIIYLYFVFFFTNFISHDNRQPLTLRKAHSGGRAQYGRF